MGNWVIDTLCNAEQLLIEDELNSLFKKPDLYYFVKLDRVKKKYKVFRNSSGKHKIVKM